VGCNYSVHRPESGSGSSVVPAGPAGMPPSGQLPTPRGATSQTIPEREELNPWTGRPGQPLSRPRRLRPVSARLVLPVILSAGELAGHRRNSINAPHTVAGHATVGGRKPVPFEGWLDLLERLSDLVRSSPLGEQSSEGDIAPSDEGGRGQAEEGSG